MRAVQTRKEFPPRLFYEKKHLDLLRGSVDFLLAAVILADEPTGNLDTSTAETIVGAFQRLNEDGLTIILVTHDSAEGRTFDVGHHQRRDRTAIVGLLAAQRLHLTNIRTQPSIIIDGTIFSVIIPASTAQSLWPVRSPTELYARVERGAAASVAHKLAVVVSPNDPSQVKVELQSQMSELGSRISDEIGRLLIGVGVTLVLVGTVNIAGIAVLDTTERTSEIGLRMAVGEPVFDLRIAVLARPHRPGYRYSRRSGPSMLADGLAARPRCSRSSARDPSG